MLLRLRVQQARCTGVQPGPLNFIQAIVVRLPQSAQNRYHIDLRHFRESLLSVPTWFFGTEVLRHLRLKKIEFCQPTTLNTALLLQTFNNFIPCDADCNDASLRSRDIHHEHGNNK